MHTWNPIIGFILLLYAVYVIYRGRISTTDDYRRTSYVSRAEKPVQFWLLVVVILLFAATLIFNVFHL